MYEELDLELTGPQTEQYLFRIGVRQRSAPTLSFLDELVVAHQLTVPFENLSLTDLDEGISLDIGHLFDKVVTRRRGGMCFELNSLFFRLLTACGFHCTAHYARVMRGSGSVGPPMHRVNRVRIDGRMYYTDVGYGDIGFFGGAMPRGALLMEEHAPQQFAGQKFELTQNGDGLWSLFQLTGESSLEVMRVEPLPRQSVDFLPGGFFVANDQHSFFKQMRTVTLPTETGIVRLIDETFTLRDGARTTKKVVSDRDHLREVLETYFGIVVHFAQ